MLKIDELTQRRLGKDLNRIIRHRLADSAARSINAEILARHIRPFSPREREALLNTVTKFIERLNLSDVLRTLDEQAFVYVERKVCDFATMALLIIARDQQPTNPGLN